MSIEAILNLEDLKKYFIEGLEESKKFSSIFYPTNKTLSDYQISLAKKSTSLNTFMNTVFMGSINGAWINMFDAPKSICDGCELENTKIHFGVGTTGWYFLCGTAGDIGFNFNIMRQEIVPPKISKKYGLDKSETVRWCISGGFGKIGDTVFYNTLSDWIYMKYTQYSETTFKLSGSCPTTDLTFETIKPMTFNFTLNFVDTTGKTHNINILLSGNSSPEGNYPNSCQVCQDGIGNFYYSYTDMDIIVTADSGKTQYGKKTGWIDHQFWKSSYVKGVYSQALVYLLNSISNRINNGWLWFAIQDVESNTQYMLTHHYIKNYSEINKGDNLDTDMVNVYRNGVAYYNPTKVDMDSGDLNIILTETIQVSGVNISLPSSYNITLPGGKKVVLKICTAPNVYLGSAIASYETPALLYSEDGKTVIGSGLIEANMYLEKDVLAKRFISLAGGNPDDRSEYNTVYNAMDSKKSFGKLLLAFIIVFIPLWIIITLIVFVVKEKEPNRRKNRLMLAIALFLIFYLFWKS
jgi:hypothetical protein